MSLAHILSQESQLSQYYEEEKEKIERKHILSKSKEPVDPALLEKGLQQLGVTANGFRFGYLKLDLSGQDLLSIIVLPLFLHRPSNKTKNLAKQGVDKFKHLQEINISCTQLTTLKPLGELKHLCALNAAYNQLHKMFDFAYVFF